MSEINLFAEDDAFLAEAPPRSPAGTQSTAASQNTSAQPAAPPQARSSIPATGKNTVSNLHQELASAGVTVPRRTTQAELLAVYNSLQSGAPLPSTTSPSKATKKTSQVRHNPYQRPDPSPSFRPEHSSRPSASLLQAPGPDDPGTQSPEWNQKSILGAESLQEAQAQTHNLPAHPFQVTTSSASVRPPPLPAQTPASLIPPLLPQVLPGPGASFSVRPPPLMSLATVAPPLFPFSSTCDTRASSSVSMPPLMSLLPAAPPLFSLLPTHDPSTSCNVSMPSQTAPAPNLLQSLSHTKYFSLSTATPLLVPPNVLALDPPPVSNTIWNQILSGLDVYLFSLLSPIPPTSADRQINCGQFSVTLKNTNNIQSRILKFPEFTVAFSRYTDVYPHRRRKLNDYLAIVAELTLSYGGSHFYLLPYHRLFFAKCAIRISQWNQSPFWGALDTELHNKVFLGCCNISCAVCRSTTHPTESCLFINPIPSPLPEPAKTRSTFKPKYPIPPFWSPPFCHSFCQPLH
nr:proline-rich protein 36-like [Danio rerio]|eukprot:XP_021330471.1 proline-rich protein 36-like [Danio rerio]